MAASTQISTVQTGAAALPTDAPFAPQPAPVPYLKAVEGNGYFQKVRRNQTGAPLTGPALLYTYCDVTDFGVRPFGNLFPSLRLPVTPAERTSLGNIFRGTALQGLPQIEKVVVLEVPANQYGEMIDGKTIELKLPVTVNSVDSVYTLYGGYYGFSNDLNNQYSDTNTLSGYLGVEPTPENDFNSNIAYLFCNQINRPKDTVTQTTVVQAALPSQQITVPARGSFSYAQALLPATTYRLSLLTNSSLRVQVTVANLGQLDLADLAENGVVNADGTFRLRQAVTQITVLTDSYVDVLADSILTHLDVTSTRNWSTWSQANRYPLVANGMGKSVAVLSDPGNGGVVDEPVGIVYLDKGLIVLTNPTLVGSLRRTGGLVTNPDVVGGTIACPATGPFTRLRYADANLSALSYRSVTTELTQTFTCMAGIGEFTLTDNSTYALAYPDATTLQALYITELGLYNQYGELMAIAKTTEPLMKQSSRPVLFSVNLRV